ncbi:TonB-dependent receptor [Thalassotalea sp. PLHSN55]|uniref:TonB-dependent receptor n=1 Tax=Thalassotalea sp. PLHSN55 TaxID=3435888 RepID=UPI003F84CB79
MLNFKPNKLTLALLSTGLMAISSHSIAAEAATAKEQEVEVIQVTGIRGALQRAQAIKMSENSIVEVISAEDIGKLPDTSIAESLARLPGVTGERRNGRTSGLSVRGFNENYIGTTLNGRELLGMGDNRGVEFDLYPTEIVTSMLVYKTPEASLISQGIGGTIDLQTVSPLNADASMAVNLDYEQNGKDSANPDFDDTGHRASFNYVNQFLDNTLGLALVVSSQETPRQEEQFRAWGYADVNLTPAGEDGHNPRRLTDPVSASAGDKVLGGHDSFARSAMMERDSIAAVIEYAPTDNLNIQLDALYIDFKESDVRRGLEEGGAEWGTGNYTITDIENGVVTAGYHDGFHSVIRNDARTQDSTLTTFGLNVDYMLNNEWSIELDLSMGDVDKTITDIESYSGVGRAGVDDRPLAARSWEMTSTGVMYSDHPTLPGVDYTNESLIRLAGPQAWGGGMAPIEEFGGSDRAQDGFVNQPEFEESLDSIRLSATGAIEFSIFNGIEFGVNYSEREKTKVNKGAFLTAPTFPSDGPIPSEFLVGTTSLDFIGINGVTAYDSIGLFNSGYYTSTNAALIENGRFGDTYTITEELLTAYAKLDIEAEIGDIYVSGNLGVQVVNSDQTGKGFSTYTNEDLFTETTPVSGGDSYTDVLPTLNLSFEVAENQFIRTAMGKVMSRPRMDDMRPNTVVSFQFNDANILSDDPASGPWSGSAGNSSLKPLEANQFDLAYENYFADDGYFAVSFFYKDLTNWHKSGAAVADFSEYYIPGYHQSSDDTGNQPPATFLGGVSYREDGLTGFVRGYELQASLPLSLAHKSLEGFGIAMSATFLDGELDVAEGEDNRVPGLSEESYSLTAYYEHEGFEIRVSGTKRDDFLTETRGISLSLVGATDQGAELWDAQIGYDFSESGIESLDGLRITLKAQNITDEDTVQTDSAGNITQYQSFGANYLLGLNYKF